MDDEFNQCCRKCLRLKMDDEWEESLEIMEKFIDDHPLIFDKNYEYHYFSKSMEKNIFFELFEPKNEVKFLKNDYCRLFSFYASTLMHFNQYDKAKSFLNIAHDLNPIDIHPLMHLVKIYEEEYEGELIEKTLKKALNIVHDEYDLFDVYEKLAEYYEQIGEIEISQLLFEIKKNKSFDESKKEYIKNMFNKYEIPLGYNPKIIEIYHRASTTAHFTASFNEEYDLYYDYWEMAEFNFFFEDD